MENKKIDLEELDKKIQALQDSSSSKKINKTPNLNIALNIMLEMFSALAVGGIIGYTLDKFLETKFIFFIIFVFLGLISGVINLNRYVKKLESKEKVK